MPGPDIAYFRRLFDYDAWANREALASLQRATDAPPQAVSIMAHVVGAEWLWLGRLQQNSRAAAVWPKLTLKECDAQLQDLAREWAAYLDAIPTGGLAESADYVNTKGESWTNTVADILLHVVMHSAYHRGQIATALRRAGEEPAYTDFIHAVREAYVT
jgi:uncharacterized damage-inducible protein DinB